MGAHRRPILPGVLLPDAAPLPVGLSTFTVKTADGAAVHRVWTTATAQNNDHFKVACSVDGKLFTTVETVTGSGISTIPLLEAISRRVGAQRPPNRRRRRSWAPDASAG